MGVPLEGEKRARGWARGRHTPTEPMVVHLSGVAFYVVVLRAALGNVDILTENNQIRRIGAAGPFLAAVRDN